MQLILTDGTRLEVDEAWESEQGIWYKQNGVSHLSSRERVKSIERGNQTKPVTNGQITKSTIVAAPTSALTLERAWVHLKGGARMEADRLEESAAGIWYRRGSLAIFIDRSRIDHIEREELEKDGESESSSVKQQGWSSGNARIDQFIKQSGTRYGVDPYLVFCVMEQESHFNAKVVSPKGARGLMQLMPGTSARFGVRHPFSPAENIAAGTRYLKQLIDKFNGRVDLVLAGYNAGEGTVVRFGHKVPPYGETRNYVKRISYRYHHAKVPIAKAAAGGNATAAGGN